MYILKKEKDKLSFKETGLPIFSLMNLWWVYQESQAYVEHSFKTSHMMGAKMVDAQARGWMHNWFVQIKLLTATNTFKLLVYFQG